MQGEVWRAVSFDDFVEEGVVVKSIVLKVGDRFRITDSCNSTETVDVYKVLTEPMGRHIFSFDAERERDQEKMSIAIGAWVHVEVLPPE